MKVKELIKLLNGVSPDTEVTCSITTDDVVQLLGMTRAELDALENYEIFCVLKVEDCENYCKLLIKNNLYQYNPKGARNKSSIVDERYNMDFINEMKYIEQEKSIPITCLQLVEELEKNKKLKNHHKSLVNLTQQLHRSVMSKNRILTGRLQKIDKLLNDLYEGIDEYYTETLERNDELAVARAEAQLQLIKKIIDKVEKI